MPVGEEGGRFRYMAQLAFRNGGPCNFLEGGPDPADMAHISAESECESNAGTARRLSQNAGVSPRQPGLASSVGGDGQVTPPSSG